jgi:hypothetical protein
MSLYYVQKILYDLNRSDQAQREYLDNIDLFLESYPLTDEERKAIVEPDIGLLYVLGVNGQLLMHFAALHKIDWDDYLKAMVAGIEQHGPVRAGVYTMTGAGKRFSASIEVKPSN